MVVSGRIVEVTKLRPVVKPPNGSAGSCVALGDEPKADDTLGLLEGIAPTEVVPLADRLAVIGAWGLLTDVEEGDWGAPGMETTAASHMERYAVVHIQ